MPFQRYLALLRWLVLIGLAAAIPGAPISWYLFWRGYTEQTEAGLNNSPGYASDPGLAHDNTWQHPENGWKWWLLGTIILFLLYLPVFRMLHRKEENGS